MALSDVNQVAKRLATSQSSIRRACRDHGIARDHRAGPKPQRELYSEAAIKKILGALNEGRDTKLQDKGPDEPIKGVK